MSLLSLYRLTEAGVQNAPTKPRKKGKAAHFGFKGHGAVRHPGDEEDDEEFADDGSDYVDMNPLDHDTEEDNPYRHPAARAKDPPKPEPDPPKPEPEPEKPTPFASKSAPMPKVSGGISVSGDKETLGALQDALQEAAHAVSDNDDLADWCEAAYKTIASAVRRGEGTIKLPKFEAVPEDLEDDDYEGED